jgi:opacity protein-like surface antigen
MRDSTSKLYEADGTLANSFKFNGSDFTFGGSVAFGYNFNAQANVPVRSEVEYAIFSRAKNKLSVHDSDDGSTSLEHRFGIQTLFANVYYDFHNSSAFTPYIGGGLGMAFISAKAKGSTAGESESFGSKRNSNFAWNIGAGAAYDITDNIALDLGYRFVGLGEGKMKDAQDNSDPDGFVRSKTKNLYMHQVGLGLRFSF